MPEVITMPNNNVEEFIGNKLIFRHLPAYANYIRDNHIVPYIQDQIDMSREMNLPIMRFIEGIPDKDLIEMGIQSHRDFLTAAENNTLKEHFEKALQTWTSDSMGIIKKDEIAAEDITVGGFIRKKAMLKFLPEYTSDINQLLEIVHEIDTMTVESGTASTNVYIRLLKERIAEQTFFSEILSNTTPGMNYTFDLASRSVKYLNKNALQFFGQTLQGMQEMGDTVVLSMVYPEDVAVTLNELAKCATAKDGEIISWEFRLRDSKGDYTWMKNYSTVFKRDEQGTPTEIVGIILDISKEKDIADKLLTRERQLLDAQAQAQVGSFELDIETGVLEVTPQFREIFEEQNCDPAILIKNVHPDDRAKIETKKQKAIADNGLYDNEYRYRINGKEKVLRSRGKVAYKNGRKVMSGTVMDITERHKMIQDLLESQELYRQAQELSHIGNWQWDIQKNECKWSEEVFRIYEIAPTEGNLRPEYVEKYRHPEDAEMVLEKVRQLHEEHIPTDYTYRILLPTGKIKYINVKGDLLYDEHNTVTHLFGTVQDITEKQLLIEQLQKSEELFKQAQARTHIGNWTWDIPENKVAWSDEMYRVYGLEPQSQEVTYETYLSHIHPEDRPIREKQVQQVFETGAPEDHHYRIIMADGSVRILHTKSELEYDKQGKPLRMTGTCQDVTEKQMLIDRLQHSEQLYKQAQSISRMGNWAWDMETKQLEWSDEVYHIYELEPQSLTNSFTLDQYTHPDDEHIVMDEIKKAVAAREPFDFNYRIILNGGKIKTLHVRGEVKRGEGKTLSIYGTIQDITEQKLVEKKIRDYQEFIEKITNVTPSIIATYNIHTGKYSYINEAVDKLLGHPVARIMEEGVGFTATIVHPDDIAAITEQNIKAIEDANNMTDVTNEPVVDFKYRMCNKNGEYRWFHTYGTIFERNEQGKVESVLNVSVDITEQEKAEQALFLKNLQLQQSNTSLEEYAYVASHDLKEPLRKIATFSDRMLNSEQNSLSDDGKVYLNKVIESSRRMQTMINDLLSVSTILGNKAIEPCDLNQLLADAMQTLDHKIEERKATIDHDQLPTVPVVPSQIRQLFQNLISNSLKFGDTTRPLHIKITHKFLTHKMAEHYGLVKAKKYLQVDVEDNGIGFDNQYAGKIFAIFQRLHGKSEYDGTGIGLAICKKIVENHDGTIFAKGEPDKGAIFTFVIPIVN